MLFRSRAFLAGGGDYSAPAQRVEDFLAGKPSDATLSHGSGVEGSCRPGIRLGDLSSCLPEWVMETLREALPAFARTIPGFCDAGALLTGVETRTSSPVRLLRDPRSLESLNTPGLYPAGEGGEIGRSHV